MSGRKDQVVKKRETICVPNYEPSLCWSTEKRHEEIQSDVENSGRELNSGTSGSQECAVTAPGGCIPHFDIYVQYISVFVALIILFTESLCIVTAKITEKTIDEFVK